MGAVVEKKRDLRPFYRSFFMLYIPLVLQNVITISVNLADNMMLGAYSETALSGVAAVNQIQYIYQQILMALGDGLVIFCSQYWGKKQLEPMKKIGATAMQTALLVSLLLFTVISLFPHQAVGCFTTDQAIIAEGVSYLSLIRFSYVFFAITILLLAILRSVEYVRIAMVLSAITFFVNCGLNAIFIYGRFGFPEMGARGAALGTLIARMVELLVLIVYIWKVRTPLEISFTSFIRKDPLLSKDYFMVTAPILTVQTLWGFSTALQTVILGHMKDGAIAAYSVAQNLFMVVKSTVLGSTSAASVIIGKAIGETDRDTVMLYSSRLQRIFFLSGILSATCLFLLRIPVLSVYDLLPETKALANAFLMILSVTFVGTAYQVPTNNGIIRGGGSAMFVVKLDLVSIWLIVLPLSFFMAFVMKASPLVVVFCLNADQLFKCVPIFIKSHYGRWIRILTRDDI